MGERRSGGSDQGGAEDDQHNGEIACTCNSESLSSKVRAWVEEGVIAESTIYTWCVLNEPAGWQVGVHQID